MFRRTGALGASSHVRQKCASWLKFRAMNDKLMFQLSCTACTSFPDVYRRREIKHTPQPSLKGLGPYIWRMPLVTFWAKATTLSTSKCDCVTSGILGLFQQLLYSRIPTAWRRAAGDNFVDAAADRCKSCVTCCTATVGARMPVCHPNVASVTSLMMTAMRTVLTKLLVLLMLYQRCVIQRTVHMFLLFWRDVSRPTRLVPVELELQPLDGV